MDLYSKTFAGAVALLIAAALYWMLAPFWGALAWAVSLAFLLAPLQARLSAKLKGRPGTAAGLITVLVPFVLVGPLLMLSLAFANQVTELLARLKQTPLRLDGGLLGQLERTPLIGPVAEWLRQHLTASNSQLGEWLDSGLEQFLQWLAATGGNFLISAMGTFLNFFMMLFLLFFFLRDGKQMLASLVKLVPMDAAHNAELVTLVGNTIRAVTYGEVLTALAQGILVGVGFAIAGLPSAVVFGVLAAILALLPVGGAALIWVPAVIWLAVTSAWAWAGFLLVWGLGVSVSDNLLRPWLISTQMPVSTLMIFVGVIGGVSAFGMIGVIIGPVLLSVIAVLLRFVVEIRARQS